MGSHFVNINVKPQLNQWCWKQAKIRPKYKRKWQEILSSVCFGENFIPNEIMSKIEHQLKGAVGNNNDKNHKLEIHTPSEMQQDKNIYWENLKSLNLFESIKADIQEYLNLERTCDRTAKMANGWMFRSREIQRRPTDGRQNERYNLRQLKRIWSRSQWDASGNRVENKGKKCIPYHLSLILFCDQA